MEQQQSRVLISLLHQVKVVGDEEGPSTSTPESSHLSNASATAKKLKYDGDVSDIKSNQETRDEHSMIMYMSVLHSLITLDWQMP